MDPRFGPPPLMFHVQEYSDADWDAIRCRGNLIQRWLLKDGEITEVRLDAAKLFQTEKVQGLYFVEAAFAFHVSPDRRRVAFTNFFGPRVARGQVLIINGQGKRAQFQLSDGMQWVS